MKKDMYSPKRNPNEFTRTPTFETTLQAIKDELRTIQGQMEELRLEFERKPPKREVKIKVPSFIGKNDPEAYLKWKIMMEKVFNCNFYNEEEKVLMATSEFKEKALSWWVQIQKGVGQIFPQEMISVLPHTNQRVELEDMVDHVHWTKTKIRIVEIYF
ncbi:hypothetical protein Lal_00043723 [Lupinus albus]|nr:hypothetical protein Lal_00043723 [Lupinus albus]